MSRFGLASGVSAHASTRGWITLEIMLALVLLSVVMQVLQHQSIRQWQTIQQGEQAAKLSNNQAKQALMAQLTGSVIWLDVEYSSQQGSYPECEPCSGTELFTWFRAAQDDIADSGQVLESEDD